MTYPCLPALIAPWIDFLCVLAIQQQHLCSLAFPDLSAFCLGNIWHILAAFIYSLHVTMRWPMSTICTWSWLWVIYTVFPFLPNSCVVSLVMICSVWWYPFCIVVWDDAYRICCLRLGCLQYKILPVYCHLHSLYQDQKVQFLSLVLQLCQLWHWSHPLLYTFPYQRLYLIDFWDGQ